MPDPKVTPQIQKCAEACAEYAKDCWCPEGDEIIQVDEDGGQDIDEDKVEKRVKGGFAALIMKHTGAEMMPECYDLLDVAISALQDEGVEIPMMDSLCRHLGKLGYGREEEK